MYPRFAPRPATTAGSDVLQHAKKAMVCSTITVRSPAGQQPGASLQGLQDPMSGSLPMGQDLLHSYFVCSTITVSTLAS